MTKVWKDNNNAAKIRPASIKVQLFADGIAEGDPVTLSAENGWAHTWTDLCVNKNESAERLCLQGDGERHDGLCDHQQPR